MKPIFKPKYKYNCYSATCITPNARLALLSSDKITIAAIIWWSSGSKTKRPFKQKGHIILNWWWTGPLHIVQIEVLMLVFLYYIINFVSLICARNERVSSPQNENFVINHLRPCHSKHVKALFVFRTRFKIFCQMFFQIFWKPGGLWRSHHKKMVLYSTKSGSWLVIIGGPLLVLYSTISLKGLYSTFVKWCYVEQ